MVNSMVTIPDGVLNGSRPYLGNRRKAKIGLQKDRKFKKRGSKNLNPTKMTDQKIQ